MAISSFRDQGTFDIYQGNNTKKARQKCPVNLFDNAQDLMDLLDRAEQLTDIRNTPGLNLESLTGVKDKFSMRINNQYRLTFYWQNNQAEALNIEKHYEE